MDFTTIFPTLPLAIIFLFLILVIWELFWKGIALWYTARRRQKLWFILLLILNTAGILPILYLIINRKRKK